MTEQKRSPSPPNSVLIAYASILVWFVSTGMHIPDGFLSISVAIACWLLATPMIAFALRATQQNLQERQVPYLGVTAAVLFAGQLLNFSVTGGTSGHLLGAALATILLGPWPAMLILTCVVSVQAVIFQDGGILSLGANILNMGVVGVLTSYGIFRVVQRILPRRKWAWLSAAGLAAWSSIEASALFCALQLSLSGSANANLVVPAMGGIHALIGLGEAFITVGALSFLLAVRPSIFQKEIVDAREARPLLIGGILLAFALAILSPIASANPDGLNWVAERIGFLQMAQTPSIRILPDYALPGLLDKNLSTILAAMIGIVILLATALLLFLFRKRPK